MVNNENRVLIVSFDGLRPDLISADLTPNLQRLKDLGTNLAGHRAVYPSETRSAFPSLVTGTVPGRHGMVGNKYVDRSVSPKRYVDTGDAVLLRKLDAESGGRLMSVPTLGEILVKAGKTMAVLATNTSGTTRFFHHKAEDFGHVRLSGHYREACTPETVLAKAEQVVGPLPPAPPRNVPDKEGQDWITSAFLDVVWPKHRPDVTVLSYGEPDFTSHFHGTGSETTKGIITHCDAQFGRVLDWWEAEGRAEGVQIIAVSDHGHITGHTRISVIDDLRAAGFRPGVAPAQEVDVVVVPGQVGALYLSARDDAQIAKLVATLTEMPWCGPVFTRAKDEIYGIAPGSLGQHLVFADHARAPDVSFAFRADDSVDQFGLVGGTFDENTRPSGLGVHGGLHPKELAAVGIIAGSAFPQHGANSSLPTDICDFAPTILHLLEIGRPDSMSGRVLHETLEAVNAAAVDVYAESFEAQIGKFSQVLNRVQFDGATYIESGTAES